MKQLKNKTSIIRALIPYVSLMLYKSYYLTIILFIIFFQQKIIIFLIIKSYTDIINIYIRIIKLIPDKTFIRDYNLLSGLYENNLIQVKNTYLIFNKDYLYLYYYNKVLNNFIIFFSEFSTLKYNNNPMYIIPFKEKYYMVSLLFKKVYNNFYSYLAPMAFVIKKIILDIRDNKEKTFMEYQINIKDFGLSYIGILFDHLKSHSLNLPPQISALKLSCYMFEKNLEQPRAKNLGFSRFFTHNKDDYHNEIVITFKLAHDYLLELYHPNGSYARNTLLSHLVLRIYFNKPLARDLLIMKPCAAYILDYAEKPEPTEAFIKVNEKFENKYNKKDKYLTTQAFYDAGYSTSDVDFIL